MLETNAQLLIKTAEALRPPLMTARLQREPVQKMEKPVRWSRTTHSQGQLLCISSEHYSKNPHITVASEPQTRMK